MNYSHKVCNVLKCFNAPSYSCTASVKPYIDQQIYKTIKYLKHMF